MVEAMAYTAGMALVDEEFSVQQVSDCGKLIAYSNNNLYS